MSILYGEFEGTDEQICENTKSLGEFLLKKLQEHGDHILLVIIFPFFEKSDLIQK